MNQLAVESFRSNPARPDVYPRIAWEGTPVFRMIAVAAVYAPVEAKVEESHLEDPERWDGMS
jgi:hypothetical protein